MKYVFIISVFIFAIIVVAIFAWENFCFKHEKMAGKYDVELVDVTKKLGSGTLYMDLDSPRINLLNHMPFLEIDYPYKVLSADFNLTADGISSVSPKWQWLKGSVLSFRDGFVFDNSAYLNCVPIVFDYSMNFDIYFEPKLKGEISINSWGKRIPIGEVIITKNISK